MYYVGIRELPAASQSQSGPVACHVRRRDIMASTCARFDGKPAAAGYELYIRVYWTIILWTQTISLHNIILYKWYLLSLSKGTKYAFSFRKTSRYLLT